MTAVPCGRAESVTKSIARSTRTRTHTASMQRTHNDPTEMEVAQNASHMPGPELRLGTPDCNGHPHSSPMRSRSHDAGEGVHASHGDDSRRTGQGSGQARRKLDLGHDEETQAMDDGEGGTDGEASEGNGEGGHDQGEDHQGEDQNGDGGSDAEVDEDAVLSPSMKHAMMDGAQRCTIGTFASMQ